jgi:hypothetical protein
MKKMMSLAAMCAVLAYASPASADLKLSGDAGVRMRNESYSGTSVVNNNASTLAGVRDNNDLMWQYRVRLNAAADLGSGYYFKAMITQENAGGGWVTVNGSDAYNLQISNFYFGRTQQDCRWAVGRLPLNAFNNPIFDLTLFPFQPLENPVANASMDRIFGLNYGTKFLSGDLRGTLVVLDDASNNNTGADANGKLNDGYALHLAYTDKIGDVTVEPQFIRTLTHGTIAANTLNAAQAYAAPSYSEVSPWTAGANVTVPAGKLKVGLSGFYTRGKSSTHVASNATADYKGYEFRVKAEYGNFLCFWDHSRTTDNATNLASEGKYTNNFVWASYKVPVYSAAAGSVTIQPTLRYLTNTAAGSAAGGNNVNQQRLRSELWATVTF